MESVSNFFKNRITELGEKEQIVDTLLKKMVFFRWLVFVLAVAGSWILFRQNTALALAFIVVSIAIFLLLVRKNEKLKKQRSHLQILSSINTDELDRLNLKFDRFDTGNAYKVRDHFYASDLDVFGQYSLFQYINRTIIAEGKDKLAAWMNDSRNVGDVKLRQQAVKELALLPLLRQEFEARGQQYPETNSQFDNIKSWMKEDLFFLRKKYIRIISTASVLVMFALLVGSLFLNLPYQIPFAWALLQLGWVGVFLKKINTQHARLSRKMPLIRKYAYLFDCIENQKFESELLLDLQQSIRINDKKISERFVHLADLMNLLDNRLNMLGALVLNGLLLWDLHLMFRLDKWRKTNSEQVDNWISTLATFDALNSLAGYAALNPEYIYPEINDKHELNAVELGHPLIDPAERVVNSLTFSGTGRFILVTGSNMAGKSTFLRTVGVNMLLGQLGVPVCATAFKFPNLQLFTSMRIGDDLSNRESTFYAELKRLKMMIAEGEKQDLFIILDEILKGTNSKDKLTGSEALIRQLIQTQSMGVLATHDLDLAKLEEENPDHVFNYNFEVQIHNEQFYFDYKLKRGVCKILNATELMKSMGLKV